MPRSLYPSSLNGNDMKENPQLLGLLISAVKDYAIMVIDPKGLVLTWNEGAERLTGYTAQEIIGTHFSKFYPSDLIVQQHPDQALAIAAGHGSYEEENWRVRKDGSQFWASVIITPIYDEQNTLIGFAKISRDLSERKTIEEVLRKSDECTRAILDRAYGAFIAMNKKGQITNWNKSAETIFGWKRSEVLWRMLANTIIPHPYREAHTIGLERFIATGVGPVINQRIEISALHKDGHEFPVELAVFTVPEDEDYTFCAFIMDISERKNAEHKQITLSNELQKSNAALEQLNNDLEQRMLSLAQANKQLNDLTTVLADSRDQAMKASQFKSEFVAKISHEIRTPLSAIVGAIEIVLEHPLDNDQLHMANLISQSANTLLSLVNEILDLSKVEAGKLDLEIRELSVKDLVESVSDLLLAKIKKKALQLETIVDKSIPRIVLGDQLRLRQILLNLLTNAIKFTDTGKITVKAVTLKSKKDSVTIHFSVTDSGRGIPDKLQSRLFEPFVQASEGKRLYQEGTGLGLSICKRLVELMQGQIGFDSTENKGSTFWFDVTLKVPPADLNAAPHKSLGESNEDPITPVTNLGKILVVEDQTFLQEVALHQLKRFGFTVDIANNGLEAVRNATSSNYDAILMDCLMPEMDGLEATRLIRQVDKDKKRHTPIIALTAGVMGGDKEECLAAGMDEYLAKPIDWQHLNNLLIKFIAQLSKNQ